MESTVNSKKTKLTAMIFILSGFYLVSFFIRGGWLAILYAIALMICGIVCLRRKDNYPFKLIYGISITAIVFNAIITIINTVAMVMVLNTYLPFIFKFNSIGTDSETQSILSLLKLIPGFIIIILDLALPIILLLHTRKVKKASIKSLFDENQELDMLEGEENE